jgi:hypothetical protein
MLLDVESEFWQKELEKINAPISGAYYFYINYVKIERNGEVEPPYLLLRKILIRCLSKML